MDGRYGTGNRKTIGIEICYSRSGGARFDAAEDNAKAIEELNRENARTRYALNRLTRAIEAIQLCPHRASCPVSSELQNQEDDGDPDAADGAGKQRKQRQQRKQRHGASGESDNGKSDG